MPYLGFDPLKNALTRLQASSLAYDAALASVMASGRIPSGQAARALDEALIQTERAMTREAGLPKRGWFKHQIYAPGLYTGYGVKTLPAVREALEQRNWKQATAQIDIVAGVIDRVAGQIDVAARRLRN